MTDARTVSHSSMLRQPIITLAPRQTKRYNTHNEINQILGKFQQHSTTCRVVNIWNSLPDYIVDVDSVHTFKSRLDKFWLDPVSYTHLTLPTIYSV